MTADTKLAIHGGPKAIETPFPPYRSLGDEERQAVLRVMDSGVLSGFIGRDHPAFEGGPEVQAMQRLWAQRFGVRHAVAVNSATSGLYAAVGAIAPEVGDEIIVSPYTMIASATCALAFNAIPVFADIDPRTFCLDPESVRRCITPRTRAIVVVHIFGQPADMDPIMALAREHGLKVIEDCAQSPGAHYKGRLSGAIGDIGVFSLNAHKTIQCGEGGVCVTDDDELALRLKLIRNHGEACVESMGYERLSGIIGQNYRIGELEAAIAAEQLQKLERFNAHRIELADRLSAKLRELTPEIAPPYVSPDASHVYYLYPMLFDAERAGMDRDTFVQAVVAEGVPLFSGYVQPIYREPNYRRKIAFGSQGFPWSAFPENAANYEDGACPVCERMYERELFWTPLIYHPLQPQDMDRIVIAFRKVLDHAGELAGKSEDRSRDRG